LILASTPLQKSFFVFIGVSAQTIICNRRTEITSAKNTVVFPARTDGAVDIARRPSASGIGLSPPHFIVAMTNHLSLLRLSAITESELMALLNFFKGLHKPPSKTTIQ
jgi:hypothetical protein